MFHAAQLGDAEEFANQAVVAALEMRNPQVEKLDQVVDKLGESGPIAVGIKRIGDAFGRTAGIILR